MGDRYEDCGGQIGSEGVINFLSEKIVDMAVKVICIKEIDE